MVGDIIYQNRSFYFTAGTTSTTTGLTPTALIPTLTQSSVGQCPSGANYWDLGVLGQPQTGATLLLNPTYSILTPGDTGYSSTNLLTNPQNVSQYCNGSRVNPGMPDADPSAPPIQFTMQPAATEDEGGNWIDVRFGPLSLSNSSLYTTPGVLLTPLGNYHLNTGSPAVNSLACTVANALGVNHDFDGQPRPVPSCSTNPNAYDRGADERQ